MSLVAAAAVAEDTAVALAAAHAERKDLGRKLLSLGIVTVPQPPRLVASSPSFAHAHRVATEIVPTFYADLELDLGEATGDHLLHFLNQLIVVVGCPAPT